MFNVTLTYGLMGLLAVTLVVLAVIDTRTFTISNRANAAIALSAPLFWWSIGLDLWPGWPLQLVLGIGVFLLMAIFFVMGAMGGGDVKLAGALALWMSLTEIIRFLIVTSLAGGVLTLAVVAVHRLRRREGRPEVPYGVAIATGGLWILAQRFLNQFV